MVHGVFLVTCRNRSCFVLVCWMVILCGAIKKKLIVSFLGGWCCTRFQQLWPGVSHGESTSDGGVAAQAQGKGVWQWVR